MIIFQEKKANRKQHQEEYSRIFLELNRLQVKENNSCK